ncbi:putative reverse transcriptase domain-containing protein [Tanacetum coccineum]
MQRGKVIAYASRQLKIHEKNYTTHDLELGAVVFALKTWRHYLYGTKSVIYTDHESLQHIFDQKELNMRQRRWIKLFSDYECEIRYHPAQSEASKVENATAEMLHGMDQLIERKEDGGEDKTYYDLRDIYDGHKALGTRLDMSAAHHPQTDRQSEHTIKTLENMLRACVIDFSGSWDVHLPLKAARDYQNSYVGNRRKQLRFEVGDKVILEVSSWKKEIKVDKTLRFVEELVEIIDRKVKSIKHSGILIVKVHWNSKRGHEDFIKTKHPHLLVEQAITGSTK